MARYIDLEELEKRIKENIPISGNGTTPYEIDLLEWYKDECIRQAYAMPTADVEEVRHGHWIFINQAVGYLEPPYGDTFKCSLCEFVIDVSEGNYKYCPNCGAKMDGERKENG